MAYFSPLALIFIFREYLQNKRKKKCIKQADASQSLINVSFICPLYVLLPEWVRLFDISKLLE